MSTTNCRFRAGSNFKQQLEISLVSVLKRKLCTVINDYQQGGGSGGNHPVTEIPPVPSKALVENQRKCTKFLTKR